MNVEFHYYVVHWLCNLSGFSENESRVIAYSSQFVDHNIISYTVQTPSGKYHTSPTQNYGFWDESFPREVYVPFHFFPGDQRRATMRRTDGAVNPMCCTPNSSAVKELLIGALKSRNPYRMGIALHTYADSWAHQNFSGLREEWNVTDPSSIVPAIGHAQSMTKPDQPGLTWEDPRLSPPFRTVSNRERILTAARMIYKYLRTHNGLPFDDVDMVSWKLDDLLGTPGREKQPSERIADFIIEENMDAYHRSEWLREALDLSEDPGDERMFKGYDKVLWLKDAVLYRSSLVRQRPVRGRDRFFESNLYQWTEAAREHSAAAHEIIRRL